MSTSNPETSSHSGQRRPLLADEFLSFEELMERLPGNTNRDAIRRLVKERGLPVHKIGKHRMFYVRELIAASAVGDELLDDEG